MIMRAKCFDGGNRKPVMIDDVGKYSEDNANLAIQPGGMASPDGEMLAIEPASMCRPNRHIEADTLSLQIVAVQLWLTMTAMLTSEMMSAIETKLSTISAEKVHFCDIKLEWRVL